MRTFASLEIRFEYVLVGKLPNSRIIRRKIRSCDSGNTSGEGIFSRQASLARQAFLITHLHGARYKTGKKRLRQKVVLCDHMLN